MREDDVRIGGSRMDGDTKIHGIVIPLCGSSRALGYAGSHVGMLPAGEGAET